MQAIRGAVISVGYARTLEICLARNMRHMTECWVATSPEDEATQAVVRSVPGARLFITDAWTRHGARFNKGLGFEELFDAMGRYGWIAIHDADIMFPDDLALGQLEFGRLHGARRRFLNDPARWHHGLDWKQCPPHRAEGPIGFLQIFSCDDPALVDRRPWYDVSFAHAGGGDAYFMRLWPSSKYKMLTTDVLHMGPRDTNWFGTDDEGRRIMEKFVIRNGWTRRRPDLNGKQPDPDVSIVDRVQVPGYGPSGFELPFVRRQQERELAREQQR